MMWGEIYQYVGATAGIAALLLVRKGTLVTALVGLAKRAQAALADRSIDNPGCKTVDLTIGESTQVWSPIVFPKQTGRQL